MNIRSYLIQDKIHPKNFVRTVYKRLKLFKNSSFTRLPRGYKPREIQHHQMLFGFKQLSGTMSSVTGKALTKRTIRKGKLKLEYFFVHLLVEIFSAGAKELRKK